MCSFFVFHVSLLAIEHSSVGVILAGRIAYERGASKEQLSDWKGLEWRCIGGHEGGVC